MTVLKTWQKSSYL